MDKNKEDKEKFLEYFKDAPIQKYAGAHIGKSEATIIRWIKEDKNFANQIGISKADYLKRNLKMVRSREWILERLYKDHFAERKEVTGADGDEVVIRFVDPEKPKYGADKPSDE